VILVDTSVWSDHLRSGDDELAVLLDSAQVWTHPFVVGELACGNLRNRSEVLALLGDLPQLAVATDSEVLIHIEQHRLMDRRIGYIDAHLLAATTLAGPAKLWSRDQRLATLANEMRLALDGNVR